jgi:hypothetical protein
LISAPEKQKKLGMKRQGPSQQRTCNSPLPIEMNVDPLAKPRRVVLLRDAPDHKSIFNIREYHKKYGAM